MSDEPLLAVWTGPHGGFPRFDLFKPERFPAAFDAAMAQYRAEVAQIAAAKQPADFENTIVAYERAGKPFAQATSLFGVYTSTVSDKSMQKLEQELSPKLSAFGDELIQNAALFARIKAVYDARATLKITPEQLRLVEVTFEGFARRGAALDAAGKQRLAAINQRLATLFTTFGQNQLADEENGEIVLAHEADLAGLPSSLRDAAKADAEAKGKHGQWRFANTRSAIEPLLTYSSRRDVREKAWRLWTSRGDNNDAHDNKKVIVEILALRSERAKLLGFASHAHWIISDNMAKTPAAAMALMMRVWKAAVARVGEEVADMQQLADAEDPHHKAPAIAPWDYRYYAEKVRKTKYDLDQDEVKTYLQLDKMREAMFWAAGQLYGFKFTQVHDVPTLRPELTVYEVSRGTTHVGLWYFDPYARDGKRSGAWMNEYRTQRTDAGATPPIVSNNANFVAGKPDEPVLISWDDAITMFHEFGHALHGLDSSVHYATLAGTNVKRDFVEFPSQLNEHWLRTKEVLGAYCTHYQTGKPIPAELVAKIERAKHFNQGFGTVEYLAAAIYDLKIHLEPPGHIDPDEFEKRTMKDIGCPPQIVMRHRPTHFGHIFSDDGYSAGYYAYMWADTLTADAAEAFEKAGFYDKATAKRLHESIMSVGNSIPPDEAFRRFRGRDVDTDALMRDRGFPV